MTRQRFLVLMVAMTLACVVALFFCPLPRGSFSSTHGPTAEMRSLQLLGLLLVWVAGCGLSGLVLTPSLQARQARTRTYLFAAPASLVSPSCLRC